MRITKLTLTHFKRFGLGGIKRLVYLPESNVQLISGINGSGKSSLLSELTPLPANMKSDYHEGGSKEICITHRDDEYILTTATKHSFVLNGEELNTAGNKRVQLSLINEHFNINPSIAKMIYGYKNMTTMSVADRKAWLALVSDVDLDYPLTVYAKLKRRYNDLRGAINLLKAKKIETDSQDELDKKINLADNKLQHIEMLKSEIIPIVESKISIQDITLKIERLEELINGIKQSIKSYGDGNLEEMLSKKYEVSSKVSSVSRDISKLESMTESKRLQSNLDSINAKLANMDKYENHDKLIRIIDVAITRLQNVDMDLVERVTSYDKSEIEKEHITLKDNISKVTNELDRTKAKLNLYTSVHEHDQVVLDCPHCKAGFKLGMSDSNVKVLEDKVKLLNKELATFKDKLRPILLKLNEIARYETMKDNFNTTINTFKGIELLKNYMVDIVDSNGLSHSLSNLRHAVKDHRELIINKHNITETIVALSTIVVSDTNDNLVNELSRLTTELLKLDTVISNLKLRDKKKEELKALETKLKEFNYVKKKIEKDMSNVIANDKIYTEIKSVKDELSVLNTEIIKMRTNLTLEDARNSELKEYTERMETVNNMMEKLSPTTGLIANTIMEDLGNIINDVNDIIANIWDYNIKVLPMGISDDTLTYKFPVQIGESGDASDDIALLSTSQREIIDLAFRIVSMVRLGLSDTTFLLDEFARTFDLIHVNKAYDIVDELTKLFNQVFIVSHFESTYTKLETKADISLLTKGYLGSDNNSDKIILEYY